MSIEMNFRERRISSEVSCLSRVVFFVKFFFTLKKNGVGVAVKEDPCESKLEQGEYSKPTTAISQLLVPISDEPAGHDKTDGGECSSHTHKKKKKHKEKDKRHDKEKRLKEEKHRHRKEHSREKELIKEPSPIKITIPKEKLVDIPMKLKIKINEDQIIPPVATDEGASNDFKLKISKDMLKSSRKRERESDHEHMSKKFAYGNANSHNGYKDYL